MQDLASSEQVKKSRTRMLDFRRADFNYFRDLLERFSGGVSYKLKESKFKVLDLGRNSLRHQYALEEN